MTLIDKIVHYMFLILIGPIFKLVYLGSDVEEKVTLFCIISILVLLTHIEPQTCSIEGAHVFLHCSGPESGLQILHPAIAVLGKEEEKKHFY